MQRRESGDAVGNLPIVDILIGGSITQIISREMPQIDRNDQIDGIEKIEGIELNIKKGQTIISFKQFPNQKTGADIQHVSKYIFQQKLRN